MQDVVIIGAGAAGIGCGVMLRKLGANSFTIVEREHTGATFDRWPEGMHFVTPSYPSHAFGLLDLNAVVPATSPAHTLRVEHPTGREYATYLRELEEHYRLPVRHGVDVEQIEAHDGRFLIHTSQGVLYSHTVIWAAGEYQYPYLSPFPGAELCLHTSQISSWDSLIAKERVVVGGYESGAEAALQLSARGVQVTLVDETSPWTRADAKPQYELSPYTLGRLEGASSIRRVSGFRVCQVRREGTGFRIQSETGAYFSTRFMPLLATGFTGSLSLIGNLFEWTAEGKVVLTQGDESTLVPGLFVAGPQVNHQGIDFSSIYQFRQRFAVIGRTLARRLALSEEPLVTYRGAGMFLDDLRCCGDASWC